MPTSERPTKTEESKWITVNGKHIEVNPGEDVEDKVREAMPSVRGEKEKNTKQTLSKKFIKRYDLLKPIFNTRDEVVYYTKADEDRPDDYKKSGMIAGFNGDSIKIFDGKMFDLIHKNFVFKKSELIKGQHWDTMSMEDRGYWLDKAGIGTSSYVNSNWMSLQPNLRKAILKTASPAGYESTTSGVSNPIYNPVNENKTVSQRVKEQLEQEKEEDTDSETKRDY